ncbi:MAG: OpgC domain-containing protein [Rhodospirillales bacterium]|nr:OpgC domain-containing protein [Rhodospirillales bacterium]
MVLIRGNRDLRADFFRGLALWWIFADHIPGDVLADYSLRNFAFCDATEIFVLLAGYGAGLAYGRAMDRNGYLHTAADVVRRAWTLYIAHIFLFVVFTAQVAYSAAALDRASYLEESNLNVLADAPYRALLEALKLHFQPSLLNILPLYIVLLLIFVPALALLRQPYLLLSLSGIAYLLVRHFDINLPSWTGGGWFFDPFAWQFLFMIGVVLAYRPPLMPRIRWPLDLAAIVVLAAGVFVMVVLTPHPVVGLYLPPGLLRFLLSEDKTTLHPFRLAAILALAWGVIRLVPMGAGWLRSRLAAPFVLAGQNSLPVFCAGIFFGFLCRLALENDDGALMQIAVNGFGALAMLSVAAIAAWYRAKGRAPRPPGATPSAPTTIEGNPA